MTSVTQSKELLAITSYTIREVIPLHMSLNIFFTQRNPGGSMVMPPHRHLEILLFDDDLLALPPLNDKTRPALYYDLLILVKIDDPGYRFKIFYFLQPF